MLALLCSAWTRDRVALAVENRSSDPKATAELIPAVTGILESKGYEVVSGAEVDTALRQGAPASQVLAALHAEALLTVTVRFVLPAQARTRGPRANPAFGFAAAYVSAKGKAWHNSLGWIADDVGTPASVVFKRAPPKPTSAACERLLWSMPRARPDPAARVIAVAVDAADPPRPPTATRRETPLARRRDFGAGAHFPIRMHRAR